MCVFVCIGHAAQWGQVKKKTLKDKPKVTGGRAEGTASPGRGRGRGGYERGGGGERGTRGRGGMITILRPKG